MPEIRDQLEALIEQTSFEDVAAHWVELWRFRATKKHPLATQSADDKAQIRCVEDNLAQLLTAMERVKL